MNILEKFTEWGIDPAKLTEKKQQTKKKIEYVVDYVSRWVEISAVRAEIQDITFIDCMCNAGVYRDGDCCTVVEVLNVFFLAAEKYPQKTFHLFCNDIESEKIQILQTVVSNFHAPVKNVCVEYSISDVNEYLVHLDKNPVINGRRLFGYGNSVILFVDPYNFGTVQIPVLSQVLKNHYCELIFNFFISDFKRNATQDQGRIQQCLGGEHISDLRQLNQYMRKMLRVGRIKHIFSYSFRITNNVELYEIVFATPSKLGLEKLKETLWKVFDGAIYHRNKKDLNQTSLFSSTDSKQSNIGQYEHEAQKLLIEQYEGKTVSFDQIEELLIENTMLRETDILSHVIKPMIEKGQIKKNGLVRCNNFKNDSYTIFPEGVFS